MFSLSQVIFLRNWITAGCSLFLWFGLSLVSLNTTANSASAHSGEPDRNLPSVAGAASTASPIKKHLAESDSLAPEFTAEEFALLEGDRPETNASLDLALAESIDLPGSNLASNTASQTGEIDTHENLESIAAPASSLTFATLIPDAASPDPAIGANEPAENQLDTTDTVAQQPVTIPSFANTNECFADCNPSEQFNFRAPAQLSLSPVAPRVVQVYPTTPGSTSPNPAPGSAPASTVQPAPAPTVSTASEFDSPLPSTALTPPSLQFQGVYLYQGDESSARARITGVYPITPRIQVGGSLDLTDGDIFSEGGEDGVNINELYITLAPQDLPNLRFVAGQLDLTSYFDRNSFAKDSATQFFNPVFSTNPALSAAGIGSRQGALVNWTITDNLEARAVVFSSDRSISEFELNAFAGEIGLRLGNLIVRGTYVTSEDSGSGDGFQEIFNIDRGDGQFGAREGDRENAYGINAEYFIPAVSLGIFGRYGYYENADLDEDGDAFNFGVNAYDLFMADDRLGIGYGQALSNDQLRRDNGDESPSVLEVFYDFRLLPGIRVGVSYQSLNEFTESIAGFRVRGDFNLVPRQSP